jgi:stage II sporulation protein Q
MSEQNQGNGSIEQREKAPKFNEGASAAPSFSWKRLLSKKWVFPATYIAAAAIILTLMWVYQGAGTKKMAEETTNLTGAVPSGQTVTDTVHNPDALAVNAAPESMQWPVKDASEALPNKFFYDVSGSGEAKQAAIVEYEGTFTPHAGIDLAREDNQTFDVVAALSGKVTAVEKHPLVGNLVEITHANGLVTVYQSLADVAVAKDADVKQGEVIAKAGRNELEKDEGVHVHFEVRQNGISVNPEQFIVAR